jgi:alkylhydroperoxidase/carboxymuconolactone decarboxylase family protein YurZ
MRPAARPPMTGRPRRRSIIRSFQREEAAMADQKPMKEFAGLFYREGALDPKTLQLVALAAMAAAGCTS